MRSKEIARLKSNIDTRLLPHLLADVTATAPKQHVAPRSWLVLRTKYTWQGCCVAKPGRWIETTERPTKPTSRMPQLRVVLPFDFIASCLRHHYDTFKLISVLLRLHSWHASDLSILMTRRPRVPNIPSNPEDRTINPNPSNLTTPVHPPHLYKPKLPE